MTFFCKLIGFAVKHSFIQSTSSVITWGYIQPWWLTDPLTWLTDPLTWLVDPLTQLEQLGRRSRIKTYTHFIIVPHTHLRLLLLLPPDFGCSLTTNNLSNYTHLFITPYTHLALPLSSPLGFHPHITRGFISR